jgi:hypothetical protein
MRLADEWKADEEIRLSPDSRKRKKRLAKYANQDLANKTRAETRKS